MSIVSSLFDIKALQDQSKVKSFKLTKQLEDSLKLVFVNASLRKTSCKWSTFLSVFDTKRSFLQVMDNVNAPHLILLVEEAKCRISSDDILSFEDILLLLRGQDNESKLNIPEQFAHVEKMQYAELIKRRSADYFDENLCDKIPRSTEKSFSLSLKEFSHELAQKEVKHLPPTEFSMRCEISSSLLQLTIKEVRMHHQEYIQCISFNNDNEIAAVVANEKKRSRMLAARKHVIDPEDIVKIQSVFTTGNGADVLIQKYAIPMTRANLSCLAPRTWLNDEVINFYMELLQDRDRAMCTLYNLRSSHFFNSFFVTKLFEGGKYSYHAVRRWTRKFDIFEKDKVFFPINISNTHWTMAVAFVQERRIKYLDSMAGTGKKFIDALMMYFIDEAFDKKQLVLGEKEWTLEYGTSTSIPQQENGYDCGVFSLLFADYLSEDLPLDFKQSEIDDFRKRICAAILRGELSYPLS